MKTKLLFWSAVLFLIIGLNTSDGALYIYFSIHSFMLFIGVFVHAQVRKLTLNANAEPLPTVPSTQK
jgi:uncharacterized membrane protein